MKVYDVIKTAEDTYINETRIEKDIRLIKT